MSKRSHCRFKLYLQSIALMPSLPSVAVASCLERCSPIDSVFAIS